MGFPSLLIINCKINPILLSLKDNITNSKLISIIIILIIKIILKIQNNLTWNTTTLKFTTFPTGDDYILNKWIYRGKVIK